MKTCHIKYVDAFTTRRFAGNPAGVVLDAKDLSESEMQAIAREMNLSETAFILPATDREANLRIRWFTPSNEVPLCGHATIASFHALAEECLEGMKTNGQHYFRLQTKSGILSVRVEKNFYAISVEFELPIPAFKAKKTLPSALLASLRLKPMEIRSDLPAVCNSYLYIPVKRLSTVENMRPEFQSLAREMTKQKVIGVCVFTLETKESSSAVHSRFFAPNIGINEDPVTGSANGPLGVYLQRYVLGRGHQVPSRKLADGRTEFIGEQGDELQRVGRVKIRLGLLQNAVETMSIAGEAVTVMNSTMNIQSR
jgi:trans-2,3-dihydro-3-hydroxyanthranilate isomerase